MLTGIIDNAYTKKYDYEDGIRRIAAQGYQSIDFQGFVNAASALWKLPDALFEAGLKNTREYVESQGLVINQAHAPWCSPFRHTTAEDRRKHFEDVAKALKGTQILGCKKFVIHPILPFPEDLPENAEETIGINLGFMGRVADYAKYYGITVCLENMPFRGFCLSKPEEIREFVEELNHPNMKVCLDTGHSAVFGIQPGDAVRMLGPDLLQCLHVHDNDGQKDLHWFPKTGVIDWQDFRQALMDIHFQGVVSLECSPKVPEDEETLYHTAAWLAGKEL